MLRYPVLTCAILTMALSPGSPIASAQSSRDGVAVTRVSQSGSSVALARAETVVPVSLDQVREVVTDYARYHEFMPHFRRSRVLARRGTSAMVYLEAGAIRDTVTLWAQVRLSDREGDEGSRRIEARMIEGNMQRFVAYWELSPAGPGATRVVFGLSVEPDLPVPVPSSLVSDQNARMAGRTLRRLKQRIAAG